MENMTLTPQPGEIRQARRAEPWQDKSKSPASHALQLSVVILSQRKVCRDCTKQKLSAPESRFDGETGRQP